MKDPIIKFSHMYSKLHVVMDEDDDVSHIKYPRARLLMVIESRFEDLNEHFVDYDTDKGLYKLPKRGKCLVLLFRSAGGIFTTVRSAWPPYKTKYYKDRVGFMFHLEMPGK